MTTFKGDSMEQEHRVMRLVFGAVELPKWAAIELMKALPDDAVIKRGYVDNQTMTFGLYVTSERFPKLKEGEIVPELVARFDTRDKSCQISWLPSPSDFEDELARL